MKGVIQMDITNDNTELSKQMSLFEDDSRQDEEPKTNDEFKDAIEETLSKIRKQSMLLGFQVSCQYVLDKIVAFERKPGSKSNNDHKRLIKDIKKFVEQGLSRNVNSNEEDTSSEQHKINEGVV